MDNENNNAMIAYLNRLKMLQNTLGFGMSPFRVFNPHIQQYNQIMQMFSDARNRFPAMPMISSLPATALSSVLAKNQNSAMTAAAAAVFLQQQAATAAAMTLKNRLNSSIYTPNLNNGNEKITIKNGFFLNFLFYYFD